MLISVLCYSTAWLGDDIVYRYNFANGEAIHSLGGIIESQNVHYFTVNGRYVAHSLVQFFVGIGGHLSFSIANAIVYCLFVAQIMKIAGIRLSDSRRLLLTMLVVLLTFRTWLAPSCQVSYVWMWTLVLYFLNIFFGNYKVRGSAPMLALLFVFSIIAGNAHEAINVGVGGALCLYCLQYRRKLTRIQVTMFVGFAIGVLLLCLAPSTLNKAESYPSYFVASIKAFVYMVRASYVLFGVAIYMLVTKRISIARLYRDNAFYWHTYAIAVVFNFIVGIYSNRQLFGAEIAALIILLQITRSMKCRLVWLALLGIIVANLYYHSYRDTCSNTKTYNQVIEQYLKSADGTVYVTPECGYIGSFDMYAKLTDFTKADYFYDSLNRYLHELRPDGPELTILPGFLRGKMHLNLPSQVVDCGSHNFLVIESKANPVQYQAQLSLCIFGFEVPCSIKPLKLEKPCVETDHWRAYWLPNQSLYRCRAAIYPR